MKFVLFIALFFFGNTILNAQHTGKNVNSKNNQLKAFSWESGLCEFKGIYDSKKYTKKQLENTWKLAELAGYELLTTKSTAFELEDIATLNSEDLDKEYKEKKNVYKNMKIVSLPYWENLRKQLLKSLEETYLLKSLAIKSYENANILVDNRFTKSCFEYVNALTQNDTALLLSTWKKMEEKNSKNNADPKGAMQRFYVKYNSEDRLLHAKLNLITFGWYNCANAKIYHVKNDGTQQKQFEKLFKNVKYECDEP